MPYPSSMTLTPGTVVERYVIEGVIGEGAMAVVYRARHRELGSLHAIKQLTHRAPEVSERLVQEGRLQSTLKDFHSRVVKLDRYTKHQTDALKEAVDAKILEQANRIQQVTETFKDALMLSNKTF